MDIGTGKDLGDYGDVPYHLIDIREPGTKYNLFEYQQDFYDVYQDITSRGAVPILCGGTGLYIEAVLKGYKLSPVPQNQPLRDSLEGKSLDELTQMLTALKAKTGSNMYRLRSSRIFVTIILLTVHTVLSRSLAKFVYGRKRLLRLTWFQNIFQVRKYCYRLQAKPVLTSLLRNIPKIQMTR